MPDHDAETGLAPLSDTPTENLLAWSDERETDPLVFHPKGDPGYAELWPADIPADQPVPLRSRYTRTVQFALGGALIAAGAIAVSLLHRPDVNPYTAATAPPAALTTTVLAAPPPAPAPDWTSPTAAQLVPPTPSKDDLFLADMHRHGIPYKSGDADAILTAHLVCNAIADGDTLAGQTAALQRSVGWSYTAANDFVFDAARAYCPGRAR